MKKLASLCIISIALTGLSNPTPTNVVTLSKKQFSELLEKNGGLVTKPGSGKGCILFANEQTVVPNVEVAPPIEYLKKYTKLPIRFSNISTPHTLNASEVKKIGANFLIAIKNDPKMSAPLIVSPDEAWAIVNIAALSKDSPSKQKMASRLRKEVSRAFAFLCGGVSTVYEKTPVNSCASLEDLDKIDMDEVPADLIQRFKNYVSGYGVTPYIQSTFKSACKHGWNVIPTNDMQRAILKEFKEKQKDATDPTNRWKRDFPNKENPKNK